MTCPHVESLRTLRRIVHLLQKLWIAAPKALWIRDRARLTRELTGQTRTIFRVGFGEASGRSNEHERRAREPLPQRVVT